MDLSAVDRLIREELRTCGDCRTFGEEMSNRPYAEFKFVLIEQTYLNMGFMLTGVEDEDEIELSMMAK